MLKIVRIAPDKLGFELDVKRYYIPLEVTSQCPRCRQEVTRNLLEDYLSFPRFDVPIWLRFYHECSTDSYIEWKHNVIMRLTLEEVIP